MIRLEAAKLRAIKGETDYAISIVKSYLSLSPNDEEFLKAGLEIYEITKNTDLKYELTLRVKNLIELYPFRYELVELLDDCSAYKEVV